MQLSETMKDVLKQLCIFEKQLATISKIFKKLMLKGVLLKVLFFLPIIDPSIIEEDTYHYASASYQLGSLSPPPSPAPPYPLQQQFQSNEADDRYAGNDVPPSSIMMQQRSYMLPCFTKSRRTTKLVR